ncbi:translation initiation factor IF-3 [Patescibacteria group bacterium]|nr:translation initiation factor IF-3 [Patescibacteria group bacterium]
MKYYKTNNRIKAEKVRLLGKNDEHLGIVKISEALEIAKNEKLDLVEISPKAEPPVAKILDFGQLKYDLKRKESKEKKSQKAKGTKGIRITPRTGKHDLEFRIKNATKFLEQGNKVKIEIILKGREKAHFDLAFNMLNKFIDEIEQETIVEQRPKRQNNKITVLIRKK